MFIWDPSVRRQLWQIVRSLAFYAYQIEAHRFSANAVSVVVDTQYPFSDVLTTTITAAKPFKYLVRIPSWTSGGTISVNGVTSSVAPSNGLHTVNVPAGTTKLVLTIPAKITIGMSRSYNWIQS
jgi:DUF1680 family protein